MRTNSKKTFCFLLVLHFGLHLSGLSKPGTHSIQSFDRLKEAFKDTPMEYRTVPFWVWNDKVTKGAIDRQLSDYQAKGFGGLFIHPRYGLVTEYLSRDWFDLVQYAVKRGKELGLYIWLYDENSFPSGFAGGHVPVEMPESYNEGQGLAMAKSDTLPSNASDRYWIFLKKETGTFSEVSSKGSPAKGEYYLFEKTFNEKSKWYGGWSYVDLIRPGVTQKFIQLTMNGYERAIGKDFGGTVPGIFTDEPHLAPPDGRRSIRWTPDLFQQFRKRWGYDLNTRLPSLFEETGEWKRVRHDYYALLLDFFIDRWAKPWYEYCQSRGFQWTGHYWEHEWPSPFHGSDNMAMYAWFQLPGIDMLFNTFDEIPPTQFGNVRSVKELSSVANQLGRPRTLSETYGAAGWELRFEDMKRLGDWEYVLGVNLMNQHLSYNTLVGDRKHDFPQSFSYHEPWWDLYKPLADYYGRLSMVLSSGDQINRILVIEPTTSAWLYYAPGTPNARMAEIGKEFQGFLDQIEKHQIEYDLGSERMIKDHGKIEGNRFVVGKRSYDVVMLSPGLENLEASTLPLLETFLEQRGKVIFFTDVPFTVEGMVSEKANRLINTISGNRIHAKSVDEAKIHLADPDFQILNPEQIRGTLFHQRRVLKDGQILYFVNSSLEVSSSGIFTIKGKSALKLDALSGERQVYPAVQNGDRIRISFDLPPAGSLLLFVSPTGSPASDKAVTATFTEVALEGDLFVKRLAPNVLTLDYCDLKLGNREETGLYFYAASDKIFKHHGFADNPWVSSTQYKTNIVDRDHFPKDSGFDVRFPFSLENGVDIESLQLVVERPNLWRVSVNGQTVLPEKDQWWLDRDFSIFKIGSFVKTGENAVTLSTHPMSIHAELEPVYILGNFNLESREKGWTIVTEKPIHVGEWKALGMPCYFNGVAYQKTVLLQKGRTYSLKLGKWDGTVADVRINGKNAGIIGWKPYELDISKYIADGTNEIEVVVFGSLKNLLGPHHNIRQRGIVTPWSFKNAPQIQPPGEKYDLENYGLFEPFRLFRKD